ncbi:thioredoxin-1-like [Pecten maximus]|uniref:thioredoxin-1-like n=1 Tax=Pecten maximus TaxID=6579 RepID=UPI00145911AB|nr:thioredoxin-1-like [Pecten maximus]
MGVTKVANKQEFDAAINGSEGKLVVVDFFATWCGPCKAISPRIEEFSKEFTNVVFLKVDVDEAEDVAAEKGISAMPTFKFFKNGGEVGEVVGASEAKIKEAIEKYQ